MFSSGILLPRPLATLAFVGRLGKLDRQLHLPHFQFTHFLTRLQQPQLILVPLGRIGSETNYVFRGALARKHLSVLPRSLFGLE